MAYPMRLELTCVCCPMGCSLLVEKTSDAEATYLSGAGCARGKKYGVREAIRPERVVTTTVFVAGVAELLSVRTSAPVPRELMGQVVAAAKRAAEAASALGRRRRAQCMWHRRRRHRHKGRRGVNRGRTLCSRPLSYRVSASVPMGSQGTSTRGSSFS